MNHIDVPMDHHARDANARVLSEIQAKADQHY